MRTMPTEDVAFRHEMARAKAEWECRRSAELLEQADMNWWWFGRLAEDCRLLMAPPRPAHLPRRPAA